MPILGGLGHGVTLLSLIWGAGMRGDTAVSLMGGLEHRVTLLSLMGGSGHGVTLLSFIWGMGYGVTSLSPIWEHGTWLCPSWGLRCGVTPLSLIWGAGTRLCHPGGRRCWVTLLSLIQGDWDMGWHCCPTSGGTGMWGGTAVPYLGAGMWGDTAVPSLGGLGHGCALPGGQRCGVTPLSHIWGGWDMG